MVLLPEGFDEHPNAHYPVLYYQGHFSPIVQRGLVQHRAAGRGAAAGAAGAAARRGYRFYQDWTSGGLPRMLIVITQDANPYYDDSYAVNSANLGPYGDALIQELYPYVEKQFRGIGQGWARAVYGGSTGGWRSAGAAGLLSRFLQRRVGGLPRPHRLPRLLAGEPLPGQERLLRRERLEAACPSPMERDRRRATCSPMMDDAIRFELVLGTKGRSAEQFDIWQAVYSPVGDDGYPQADHRSAHRRDRSQGGRVLERALRSATTSCSATGKRSAPN